MKEEVIRLAHGSGGLLTSNLIKNTILKYFKHKTLKQLTDSAELRMTDKNIAFTTDSYVVDPLFFPGGDIGMLAICGTVNDLAMQGAVPKYTSLSLIIEEGLPVPLFEKILSSAARAARKAKVDVVKRLPSFDTTRLRCATQPSAVSLQPSATIASASPSVAPHRLREATAHTCLLRSASIDASS